MGCLSYLIDPRFLHPLATVLAGAPRTELELREKFMRGVPNRNLSQRSLRTLLELARQGGLITFEQGIWRIHDGAVIDQGVIRCLNAWCSEDFTEDRLFRDRCEVHLGRGMLTAAAEYIPLQELATRPGLTANEWSRLISGPYDLRQLTGWNSKHSEADFLILYRSADTLPITDDSDVTPRVPRSLLPSLPAHPEDLISAIRYVRESWSEQVSAFLAGVGVEDLSGFLVYAKELLDLLFWGTPVPLRSLVTTEHLSVVSDILQRFGIRAEDLSTVWKTLPFTYRTISRLSWGVRYLNNNLSHPEPEEPHANAFVRVCSLPVATQSAISTSRTGHSLLTLIRPLRVLHRALLGWRSRSETAVAARDCANAIAADMQEDKLLRREFAERVRNLNVIGSVHILDALAHEVPVPYFPVYADEVLTSAGLIAAYSQFLELREGNAYAEVRLALHAELDFKRRFNVHSLTAPQRYDGVWRGTVGQLVTQIENTRKTCIHV